MYGYTFWPYLLRVTTFIISCLLGRATSPTLKGSTFNPVALRMAKTLRGFGRFVCNRVKHKNFQRGTTFKTPVYLGGLMKILPKMDLLLTLLHLEWQKLYRILVILSAIGLNKRICSLGSKCFPSSRVASPDSISIHLKTFIIFLWL